MRFGLNNAPNLVAIVENQSEYTGEDILISDMNSNVNVVILFGV